MPASKPLSIRFTSMFNPYALTAYRVCLSWRRPRLRAASFRVIAVVLKYFFIPQFRNKRGAPCCPIVNVEHSLDELIPFKPEYRPVYMSFTILWISIIGYIYRLRGKEAEPDIFALFRLIEKAYLEAYWVYSRVMTTTDRPKPGANIKLAMVHAIDPHLYCIPSLHVVIVSIAWLFVDRLSKKPGYPDLSDLRDLIYRQAVKITESILLIKQHSVNCIPAGLYTICHLMKEYTPQAVEEFIDRIFTELEPDLPGREEVRGYIKQRYRRLMEDRRSHNGDYREVLLAFIEQMER